MINIVFFSIGEHSRTNTNEPEAVSRKAGVEKSKLSEIPYSMLDQDVLRELPEDVQKEILEFYGNQNVKSGKEQTEQVVQQMVRLIMLRLKKPPNSSKVVN